VNAADRDAIAALCAARAGLRVDAGQAHLIESRLAPVARRAGYASTGDLVAAVREGGDEPLAWATVEAMAGAEGAFFQDGETLARLWREIVPEFARRRPAGRVRIWSAGCGAGQEVYSLAMLQVEAPSNAGPVDLFGSDLSERQLERARLGLYSHFEVQKGLSAQRLVRHFENHDDRFVLARRVRDQVRWRRVNPIDDVASLGVFDIVLCRRLLGAMTEPARKRTLANLARALAPDGILLLGREEAPPAGLGLAPVRGLAGAFVRLDGVRAAA